MDDGAELSGRTQQLSSRDRTIQRVASWVAFVVLAIVSIVMLALKGKL
jgi:hypothetical protein